MLLISYFSICMLLSFSTGINTHQCTGFARQYNFFSDPVTSNLWESDRAIFCSLVVSNGYAKTTPTSTSIDKTKMISTSSIGIAGMTPASFITIYYENCSSESFRVRAQGGAFFQRWNTDKVILDVGFNDKRKIYLILSVNLKVLAIWGELNSWLYEITQDEVVCHIRWSDQVITSLQLL